MHHRVFVYGTLRQGQVNHTLLVKAWLLGTHRTTPAYTMYHLGAYPGVVARGQEVVVGEVYRVDVNTLRQLDRLEDYPRLYGRTLIPTPYGRAWIYLYQGKIGRRSCIPGGDWTHPSLRGG